MFGLLSQNLSVFGFEVSVWTLIELSSTVLAVLSFPSVLLHRQTRPLAALTWLLIMLMVPVLGLVAWWLLGRNHLKRRRRRRKRAVEQVGARLARLHATLGEAEAAAAAAAERDAPKDPIRRLLLDESDGVFPTRSGNAVKLLAGASEAYPEIEAALRAAKHHIHFQFYIWQNDATGRRFRDLLAERARAGIEVRVIFDAIGGGPVSGRFMNPLRAAGAQVAAFNPMRFTRRLTLNFRNHRKIVVVDAKTAFTGGLNIGDEYLGFRDIALRLDGPAVDQLQEVFAEDWHYATGHHIAERAYFGVAEPIVAGEGETRLPATCRVIASGPDRQVNATHQAYFLSINSAQERVWITTPYFVPDSAILMAIQAAAFRGVDVRILLPEQSDVPFVRLAARSYYQSLVAAGVRVFEYQGRVLHAKSLVFDGDWSIVGSANVDIRSFRLNFEAGCILYGEAQNGALADRFLLDLKSSREVTEESIEQRGWARRLMEAIAQLFSPLL